MIRLGKVVHSAEAIARATELLREGKTTEAEETALFEKELAAKLGYKHAVACSSGTGALWLIFSQLKRQEVVTTPLTFAATYNVPQSLGFRVRFRDIEQTYYGLDPGEILPEDKHALILTVHLLGYPSQVSGDISDACESVGADLPKPRLATAVSFYPSHTIGIGELGAVLTDSEAFATLYRWAKDNGRNRFLGPDAGFERKTLGLNFKASEITCMLARYQLHDLEAIIDARRERAKAYVDTLPYRAHAGKYDNRAAYLGFPVIFENVGDRIRASEALAQAGIEYRRMFPLPTAQPWRYPKAYEISDYGLYLPCHQSLEFSDVYKVVATIAGIWK